MKRETINTAKGVYEIEVTETTSKIVYTSNCCTAMTLWNYRNGELVSKDVIMGNTNNPHSEAAAAMRRMIKEVA